MIYLVLCLLNFISFFLPFFLAASLVWGNNRHLGVSSPSHPNISVHLLHTVLSTFHEVLTRRICLTIKSFLIWGFEVHNVSFISYTWIFSEWEWQRISKNACVPVMISSCAVFVTDKLTISFKCSVITSSSSRTSQYSRFFIISKMLSCKKRHH